MATENSMLCWLQVSATYWREDVLPSYGKTRCCRSGIRVYHDSWLLLHGFSPPGACASMCISLQLWKAAAAL
jgi:hypothetical protein